jgi:hypothetical protein
VFCIVTEISLSHKNIYALLLPAMHVT